MTMRFVAQRRKARKCVKREHIIIDDLQQLPAIRDSKSPTLKL